MRNLRSLRFLLLASASLIAAAPFSALLFNASSVLAAEPADYLGHHPPHRMLSGDLPAGAMGQARLMGRGPVAGYFQPVAFSGPPGVSFALAVGDSFEQPSPSLMAGLLIGNVYRFRITHIPLAEGVELYPTVELIDRTYPPPGLATRYPIPINLDAEDLDAALEGRMVTRVIYLEDPQTAIALPETPQTSRVYDVAEYQDAMEVADRFGRPVAIIRIGSVTPPNAPQLMSQFFFGFPTWAPIYQPQQQPQP